MSTHLSTKPKEIQLLLTTNFDSMFHTWDDESISIGILVNILFLKSFSHVYVFFGSKEPQKVILLSQYDGERGLELDASL